MKPTLDIVIQGMFCVMLLALQTIVFVCVCLYVYVCMYVCMYVRVCVCVCVYVNHMRIFIIYEKCKFFCSVN